LGEKGNDMRILVDIGHPAHVHFFKNIIWKLEERGHEVKITAREKDVTLQLLNAYGFEYENLGEHFRNRINKALGLVKRDYKLLRTALKFNPDILVGLHNPYVSTVGKLIGRSSIVFVDSEPVTYDSLLTYPFADVICTPMLFRKDLGKKHVRFNGYKELAYLHPNYFKPDPAVIKGLGMDINQPFSILRFVRWQADHDRNQSGFDLEIKRSIVRKLEGYGKVFISSEGKLPPELEKYGLKVSPDKIHDLLYYAQILVCDSQTMATEAAILGTPVVRSNTLVGSMSNFEELEKKYGLIYSFRIDKRYRALFICLPEDKIEIIAVTKHYRK